MNFRRQIAIWSLFTIMFVQTFGLSLLYNLYYTVKPVFIELFCVNKDIPEMHCNGSCMLSKMDKQQEQDTDKSTAPKVVQLHPLFFEGIPSFDYVKFIVVRDKSSFTQYQNHYSFNYIESLFRPPITT